MEQESHNFLFSPMNKLEELSTPKDFNDKGSYTRKRHLYANLQSSIIHSSRKWKQPKRASRNEQINRMCCVILYIYTQENIIQP